MTTSVMVSPATSVSRPPTADRPPAFPLNADRPPAFPLNVDRPPAFPLIADRPPAFPLIADRRYSLFVSTAPEDRVAAQRLRAKVFRDEPGFTLPAGSDDLDADHFDEFCDHLLVRENSTGDIVGCYRMLPPHASDAAGGYYTATEFDISELCARENGVVEMGRACVRPDHRSGSVLGLMWAGILRYLDLTGHGAVMGCVSVPMDLGDGVPPGAHVRGVRDLLLTKHASQQRVRPYRTVVVDGVDLDDIAPAARPTVPPLLRGYLRLGATICGEPSHDPDFGVADFVAVLRVVDADVRYLDRLRAAANSVEGQSGVGGQAGGRSGVGGQAGGRSGVGGQAGGRSEVTT